MESHPSGIQLYLSNRLENLADALIENIRSQPGDPLNPTHILVQSRGMARWLSLRIADRTGIQMNTKYLFPKALVDQLLTGLLDIGQDDDCTPYSPNGLFWRIYKKLPDWANKPESRVLKHYLTSEQPKSAFLRRYQLALKLSRLMDNLQVYRSDLLKDWAKSDKENSWKSLIWKDLADEAIHFPGLLDDGYDRLASIINRPPTWPDSLHVIGISALPVTNLCLLKKASKWMPVSIYLTQPSPLYWGDQLSQKKQLRETENKNFSESHPLLGNLGMQGQQFLNQLIDIEVFASESTEYFSPPPTRNLLGQLKKDLYDLKSPPSEKQEAEAEGIEVHVCHNPLREIEVLKDTLLARFEADPELTPDQVIVMAPNIESYSSAIRSVFGIDGNEYKNHLPYSLTDQSKLSSSPEAKVLLGYLKLLEGRCTSNEVVSFLSMPLVSERFAFSEEDWEILSTWIQQTGIRWGINQAHREAISGSAFEEFSWTQGIDRLLAGVMVHGEAPCEWDPLPPYPHIEGGSTQLLNRFLEFWNSLEQRQTQASTIQRTTKWIRSTRTLLQLLFHPASGEIGNSSDLFQLLETLRNEATAQNSDEPMPLNVFISLLEDRLSEDHRAKGFFSGKITFCSLKPMRNIPVKIIALIGMNEGTFPRVEPKNEFTVLPGGTRSGDPSSRVNDRYLFLESILAAKSLFYISYSGMDPQTLETQPSSVVIEELLDILDDYFSFSKKQNSREALVSTEPLQAFSPRNFLPGNPKSFSQENLEAAEALTGPIGEQEPFISNFSLQNKDHLNGLELRELLIFFQNPCRYWLHHRLETSFPLTKSELEDTEPLEINPLQNFKIGNHLLIHDSSDPKHLAHLRDFLPVGALRETRIQENQRRAQEILARKKELQKTNPFPHSFRLQLGETVLDVAFPEIGEKSYVTTRYGKIRPQDILQTWIEHLCLCAQPVTDQFTSCCLGLEETVIFKYVSNAEGELHSLLNLFKQGQSAPLPLFSRTSHAFAEATLFPSPKARTAPIDRAYSVFNETPNAYYGYLYGESYDEEVSICFADTEIALDKTFESVALATFGRALSNYMEALD